MNTVGPVPLHASDVLDVLTHNSPNLVERRMEHKFKVEDERNKNVWESFCMRMDRRAVQFFTQIVIIASIMMLCAYQLVNLPECDAQQSYLGLLTLLIGLVLPNPTFHDAQETPE